MGQDHKPDKIRAIGANHPRRVVDGHRGASANVRASYPWSVMPRRKISNLIPMLTFVLFMALAAAEGGQIRSEDFAGVQSIDWTPQGAREPLLSQRYEPITLQALLVETLVSSPAIAASTHAVGIEYEQIIAQDAAFDSRVVLGGGYGLTNDPVGNTLVTGGPPRLRERSWDASGGIVRNTRSGANWDISQDLGLLDSNSQFFLPADQGNARLNLALTQPLLAGRGNLYNTRLVVQAKIDASVAWEQMRLETIQRLAEVTQTYFELHEQRCHAAAQADLVRRAEDIQRVVLGRADFDVARLGLAKTQSRIGLRRDRLISDLSDVARSQARLRALSGTNGGNTVDRPSVARFRDAASLPIANDAVMFLGGAAEWIPTEPPTIEYVEVKVADAVGAAMQYRAEIRSAMKELQSSALGIKVSKNQLLPRLDAVLNGYLTGLNGNNDAFRSFGDQFTDSGPGVSALLQYELPYRNRAARSRYREAMHRYRQATFELQSIIVDIRGQIESAIISIDAAQRLRQSKRQTVAAATDEELVLTKRYEFFGPDGGSGGGGGGAAILLESLLEAQQRRTDAIRALASAEIAYHAAWAQLQRAMGTVLIANEITPIRNTGTSDIQFVHSPAEIPSTPLSDLDHHDDIDGFGVDGEHDSVFEIVDPSIPNDAAYQTGILDGGLIESSDRTIGLDGSTTSTRLADPMPPVMIKSDGPIRLNQSFRGDAPERQRGEFTVPRSTRDVATEPFGNTSMLIGEGTP